MSPTEKIAAALTRRGPELCQKPLTRLFDGAADGDMGLILDGYGEVAVAHYLPPDEETRGMGTTADAGEIRKALTASENSIRSLRPQCKTLLFKNHPRDPRDLKARQPEVLWGPDAPASLYIEEGAFQFEVRPAGSLFCGLYPDTAFLRERLAATRAKKVMNTFCFTGSLGIACAVADLDQEILQIDSSPAALEWAGANWKQNEARFPTTKVRLLCDDCLNFMERESRRIEKGAARSDVIILDPPSFGRGRNKVFALRKDAPELVAAALACLAPGGILVFTANYRPWPPERMAEIVEGAARKAGRAVRSSELLRPPALTFPSREPFSISVRGVWAEIS